MLCKNSANSTCSLNRPALMDAAALASGQRHCRLFARTSSACILEWVVEGASFDLGEGLSGVGCFEVRVLKAGEQGIHDNEQLHLLGHSHQCEVVQRCDSPKIATRSAPRFFSTEDQERKYSFEKNLRQQRRANTRSSSRMIAWPTPSPSASMSGLISTHLKAD